jgi:Holliday junction DNA helicase RuvB
MTNADALRPGTLAEFGGQPDLIRDLSIMIDAARQRGQLCDHILLSGPPGLGKTTLAGVIAHELAVPFVTTSAPALEKPGDVASLLSGLSGPSLVFVDEIHALPVAAEEMLYSALEDGVLDFVVGDGVKSRSLRINLAPFVLVGATTQSGALSAPLRDRFGFHGRVKLYDTDALARIVQRSARLLGVDIDSDAAAVIAGRSRGTPRVANRWLRRVRDWAQVHTFHAVDSKVATDALDSFGVDHLGLDELGREILLALISQFKGGPVGVSTLAAAVGESPATIEEVYEPHLMRTGLLARTPRGRVATDAAWAHLGLPTPQSVLQSTIPVFFDQATNPDR